MKNSPLFLARAVYRRRRLRDAARLLPLVGLLLVLLPGLGAEEGSNAFDAVYLFAVWIVLISTAALIAPGLSQSDAEDDTANPVEEET